MILEEYKSGNSEKRVFLQTVKASLQKKKIDLGEKFDKHEELKVLKNELKQLSESLLEQQNVGREEMAEQTRRKIEILEKILPEKMSETELEKRVGQIIEGCEDKSFASVMKSAISGLSGSADGGEIAQVVKKVLSENG